MIVGQAALMRCASITVSGTTRLVFLFVAAFSLGSAADALKTASPAECMPAAADYTIMWWQHGWMQHALLKPAVLCLQTGRYGLALDVETLKLIRFGRLQSVQPYEMAARERPDFLESLPRGQFELAVVVGDKRYICRQA